VSLVIGRVTRSGVRLSCDSQVTDPLQPRNNLIPGRLKLIVLSSKLCVGFAGQLYIAMNSIGEVARLTDVREIARVLLERHRETGEAADFLVAALEPPTLTKVAAGQLFSGGTQYWIGDSDATRVLGQHYDAAAEPKSGNAVEIAAAKLIQAFEATIMDPRAPTVGGLVFSVATDRDGLRYAPAANVFFPPQSVPSGVEVPLRFGGAAQGGYAYSIYTPKRVGVPIVGVYFLQGRCGLIYRPLVEEDAVWVTEVSQEEFRQRALDEFGVTITGITFN
jgi:hypothetical protein